MRRDQYPDMPCFNGSGFPMPSNGARWHLFSLHSLILLMLRQCLLQSLPDKLA